MIELYDNQLLCSFPEVHPRARARIEFQRTLRIPDDDREYPLPAGLGQFPLNHVDDFQHAPDLWKTRGGVFMPMWQAEAAWIRFESAYPMAIKVAAGKINAVTGDPWINELSVAPQDYIVAPEQPWLDGFCVGEGLIRQFVAMPMGQGFTTEEQITGVAEHGGLQIIAYPMRRELYDEIERKRQEERRRHQQEWELRGISEPAVMFCRAGQAEMGMASGGLMRQEIYADEHGIDAWDQTTSARCFVHLANAEKYQAITGLNPPQEPPKAKDYRAAGIPWFDYYDADRKALDGSRVLRVVDSLATIFRNKGKALPDNTCVDTGTVKQLRHQRRQVREGG